MPDTGELGIICPQCGAGNDVRRHFCRRCGSQLALAPTVRTPWYRRLFPRRQGPAAGDRRAPAREATLGSLLRTFVLTILAVVLVAGLVGYAVLPGFRQAVDHRAGQTITELRRLISNPNYVQVHPVSTVASSAIAGHPAEYAADLIDNDYWAADMARDHQPTLMFTFDGKTDLDALVITSGAAADFARLARPKTVQIIYSDGTGQELTLQDDPKPIAYYIYARQVTSMTMKITSVYPVAGTSQVAVAEVEFRKLK